MASSVAPRDPEVQGDTLVCYEGDQRLLITVGTPDWYAWLSRATSFSFVGDQGRFTAYQERRERGECYWKAYCRRAGKLHRVYLGKAEHLSVTRLNEAAADLAIRAASQAAQAPSPDQKKDQTATAGLNMGNGSSHAVQKDPLLTTKLSPPVVRPELVARPRLTNRLLKGQWCKLTLISSPAGFGKTTLLSQWSHRSPCPVAWVSLDAADNDPARFWAYVIAALQTLNSSVGSTALTMLRTPQRLGMQTILTVLTNEVTAAADDLVLVLDDYQVIEDRAIHDGLSFLIDHIPPRLHLVIASRTDPPLPFALLRGRGQLCELRSADLSFTPEETAAFLNEVMRLGLSDEDVAELGTRTEGWIAGLQMAALLMEGTADVHQFISAFAGDHRYVVDYMIEEVARRQPESVQSFLLQTSILDRMSGPLCEAVTGLPEGEGQAMLEVLERTNLFTVALDNERCWYRYHRLFARCLKTRLRQLLPSRVPELHRRAAAWHAEASMASEAVGHTFATGDLELVASMVERHGALMVKRGEVATLLGWIRALPEQIVRSRPLLCIWHAHALVDMGQLESAAERLEDAQRILGLAPGNTPTTGEFQRERADVKSILNHMLAIHTSIAAQGHDTQLAIALSRQALEHSLQGEEYPRAQILHDLGLAYRSAGDLAKASELLTESSIIGQASGDMLIATMALTQLTGLQTVQGRLRQALKTCQRMLSLVVQQGEQAFPVASRPYMALALLHYEWNDLQTATRYAAQGIERSRQGGMIALLLAGHSITARVKQAQGDIDGALEAMEEAEQLARTNNVTQELAKIDAYRVRLWLKHGNIEAALRWAETSGLGVDDDLSYSHETGHLTLARVLIAQDQALEAVRLLDRLLQAAEAAGRTGSAIKILALRALAWQSAEDVERALTALTRGLALAEPEGYVRTFVDTGTPIAALLSILLKDPQWSSPFGVSPGYVRSLLAAFHSGAALAEGSANLTEPALGPLSRRELEVLQLVALGKRSSEIAEELTVSIGTVKTHIKSIYAKLEAHSGTEAVAKARDWKLL
ncbi:MAG: helix-turn-helix transcriptional regulator [Chloroflexota bacterium]|nr:MAG: helix-turn-helix transcriptional regulator [Chloroflexota bacterium]